MVRNALNTSLFVLLSLGLLLPVVRLPRPVDQLSHEERLESAYRVDDLRVEGIGDIEDGLLVNVGENTIVLVWWIRFPERLSVSSSTKIEMNSRRTYALVCRTSSQSLT